MAMEAPPIPWTMPSISPSCLARSLHPQDQVQVDAEVKVKIEEQVDTDVIFSPNEFKRIKLILHSIN